MVARTRGTSTRGRQEWKEEEEEVRSGNRWLLGHAVQVLGEGKSVRKRERKQMMRKREKWE